MSRIIGLAFYFIILLNSICSYGQIKTNVLKSEIDSLINIIPNFQGTKLVDHLNFIATSISQHYPDSCLYYANQASELSDSLNYDFGEAEAIFNIGNGHFYKFDLKNALTNYLAALCILEKFGDIDSHGNLALQIGFINTFVGNHEKSLEYYRKAQSIFNKSGNQYAELFTKRRIGYTFSHHLRNYDSAFLYFNQALTEYIELGHKKEESRVLNDIGNIYQLQKDGYKSLPYYEKSLKIARDIGYVIGIGVTLENLGWIYLDCLDKPYHHEAETYYLEAIETVNKRCEELAGIYSDCGYLYTMKKNYNKANKFLKKGLKSVYCFYNSIDTLLFDDPDKKYSKLTRIRLIHSRLYNDFFFMYQEMGEYENALKYHMLMRQAEDSIFTEANRRLTDVILTNAENESIAQQIEILEKEKELQEGRAQRSSQLLIGSGVLIVLIILIAILFIRLKRFRIEREKTNLQQKLLRSQMNPHFIFNSLTSIQGFITEKDPRTASRYLSRFAKLIRNILDSSVEEFIPLAEEIVTIENYLELQKVRYEDKFDYTIEVDKSIDTETMTIPPMLAQPFIENSIEHGFKHKKDKGALKIHFGLKNNILEIEVEDDGVGRAKGKEIIIEQNQKHKSLATSLTQERIRTLNKKLTRKVSLIIQDLKDDKEKPRGTRVVIEIPI